VKIAVIEWLRMPPLGVETAGSNSSKHFTFIFLTLVTVLLEYLDPAIYTRLVFSL